MTLTLDSLLKQEEQLVIRIQILEQEIQALLKSSSSQSFQNDESVHTQPSESVLEDEEALQEFDAPEWCIPIKANVLDFEWNQLAKTVQFDVILMDPPWQLASHMPTRGVAIGYQQLPDILIESLPIPSLQTRGFLFIWVINNKYQKAFDMFEKWGYE